MATGPPKDPNQALKALADDHEAGPDSWNSVIAEIFPKRPDEAVAAIKSLPPGKTRDHSYLAISNHYEKQSNPVAATEWALGIDDLKTRKKAFESILSRTTLDLKLARDPELKNELSKIISSETNLTGEQKTHWLHRLETEFTK